MLNRRKILILGGAGFIGSNLAIEFFNKGARIKIVDGFLKHTGANIDNIKTILEEVEFYDCKVENCSDLRRLVQESDLIIDSMGLTSHVFGMEHLLVDVRINLISHIHVIDALKSSKHKKVIYLGSRGQYGRVIKESVITEDTSQRAIDSQGVAKTAAESLYRIYAQKFGFRVLSLRITNCFGENQKFDASDIGLVGSFIRDVSAGKAVEVFGNSNRKKNLVYVKDLVRIIAKLSTVNFDTFEVYNVAGDEVSLATLLDTIIRCIGEGRYTTGDFPDSIRKIDVGEAQFNDDKLKAKLGTLNYTEIETSIRKTVTYFQRATRTNSYDL